jgi:fido (protein-threonine AMPylation protein)
VEYIAAHRRLFDGIYAFAGKVRDYNITKKEWALHGATVYYTSAQSIRETLDYDFSQEKAFSYKGLTLPQTSKHIAKFISDVWQIHAFGEGNTRTTAVFAIKYLRSLGFDVTNDIFAANAWYFRNALVRANYSNLAKGIHATQEYLDRFFGNLILGENNTLQNRELLVVPKVVTSVNGGEE